MLFTRAMLAIALPRSTRKIPIAGFALGIVVPAFREHYVRR